MKTSPHFPRLLVFGKPERKEFRIWWENLNETIREHARFHENLSAWLNSKSHTETETPDFIILLRSCPGEFHDEEVWTLTQKYPLSPVLAVTGNWCEGESRSGFPLAGVHSISWYDFAVMSPLEWWFFSQNWATIWSLPPSALPEQYALFELQRGEKWNLHASESFFGPIPKEKTWKIRIESDDFAQFSFLRDFCQRVLAKMLPTTDAIQIFSPWERGKQGEILPTDPDTNFLFFDFPDFMEETVQWFYALKKRYPHAIYVAFTEFPRPEEWAFLKRCGVDAIFPKPFRIVDLLFFCRQCLTAERKEK